MAHLRWRRAVELAALDRPWLGRALLRRRPPRAAPSAAAWDTEYRRGDYDRLRRRDQRHHHRLLAAVMAEAQPGLRLLDVGCGEGLFWHAVKPFAPARYFGIDLSPEAIDRARADHATEIAAGAVEFAVADASSFASKERFDAIVFPECIEYLGDLEAVIARYAAMLAPGGSIGLTMWLGPEPVRRWWRLGHIAEVEDEAVVTTSWGGAWIVARLTPR